LLIRSGSGLLPLAINDAESMPMNTECAVDASVCDFCAAHMSAIRAADADWSPACIPDTAHRRAIRSQCRELPHMNDTVTSDTVSPEAFEVLVGRTGLKLTPTQFNELRNVYPKLLSFAARVRAPRDVSAEPAATFSPMV
jgi:hypothetical protein